MTDHGKIGVFKPAFFLHVDAYDPVPIYSNESGSLSLVKVFGGYTKTIDPKYPFDTTLEFGIDNLTTKTSRDGAITDLDCQLYLRSNVNGGGIHFTYSGVVVNNEKTEAVVAGKEKDATFTDAYVTNHPRAALDKSNTTEAWIQGKNLLGKGRFIRTEKGNLSVEYTVYVLEHEE